MKTITVYVLPHENLAASQLKIATFIGEEKQHSCLPLQKLICLRNLRRTTLFFMAQTESLIKTAVSLIYPTRKTLP